MRQIAIGDIHGCNRSLNALIEDKIKPDNEDELIFVGDYIDRGPGSKEVIDYILTLRSKGIKTHCLKGNHEENMMRSIHDQHAFNAWIHWGGKEMLESFGIDHPSKLNQKYLQFFNSLDLYYEFDHCFVVHGGFNFDLDDFTSDKHAMLWNRDNFTDLEKTKGKKIIHGHTPEQLSRIEEKIDQHSSNINIDNGCVYNQRPGMGNLLAIDINSLELFIQPNIDN